MFTQQDFQTFATPMPLHERMEYIQTIIGPKFESFAQAALPILETDGQVWTPHIAKHLRRTAYPPDNTWVAFAPNKRGYKMMPHFELGIWEDNAYLWLAVLENMKPNQALAAHLETLVPDFLALPSHYVLSVDHMTNAVQPLTAAPDVIARYGEVKRSEVLVGLRLSPEEVAVEGQAQFLTALEVLLPLYEKIRSV